MNTINKWDYAPEGATHHAVDADGRGFWYSEEPYFSGTTWWPRQEMTLGDDREYWKAAAAHSLEARPATITAEALEATGWTKGRGGYYWKTYRPSWKSSEGREECSVRVKFDDDYFPKLPFMVWFSTGSIVPLPRIKTMEQLETLLDLVGEESAPFEHATERKIDRNTPEDE